MPVDRGKLRELLEPGQRFHAVRQLPVLALETGDAGADPCHLLFPLAVLRLEGGDLGRVRPAQHIPAAIEEGIPVILLVASPRLLDLAGPGDGPGFAQELLRRFTACHVEPMGRFALQPVEKGRIWLDRQFANQRIGVKFRQGGAFGLAHEVVDEPSPQAIPVDPLGYALVQMLGNEHRKPEIAQKSLGGAFPGAFFLSHLEKLARERHFVLADTEGLADRIANLDLGLADVAPAALQAVDLFPRVVVRFFEFLEIDLVLGQLVLHLGCPVPAGLAKVGKTASLGGERVDVFRRPFPDVLRKLPVPAGPLLSRFEICFQPPDLRGQPLEPVAPVLGDGTLQIVDAQSLFIPATLELVHPGLASRQLLGQARDALVEQSQLQAGEMRTQGIAAPAQFHDLIREGRMPIAVFGQRLEQFRLTLGLQDGLVSLGEIVEMPYQAIDARLHVERLQHVMPDEIREIAHGFHRDGLMKQLQRLLVADAEPPPEPGPVFREILLDLRAETAKPLLQMGNIGAEPGKIGRDRQLPLASDVETSRLALGIFQPEHLRQRDGVVISFVIENAEDDGIPVRVAQAHRFRRKARLAPLGLVMAKHVGTQRALPEVGAGGLVVGDPVRGYEKRGHGIDERRFSRADIAGEQAVPAVQLQRPDLPVERAPVVDFEPLQPEACESVVGCEIELLCQSLMHGRSPWKRARDGPGKRPAARRSRSAIGRR
ncbi:MAG: hypothetical protein BWY66_00721 [bacterium ADurb.Bin374]|nr:MAG: hypothetical protein BWY66_00721 [bacterium ADurb.Bin374]